jgi:hypothetical protein
MIRTTSHLTIILSLLSIFAFNGFAQDNDPDGIGGYAKSPRLMKKIGEETFSFKLQRAIEADLDDDSDEKILHSLSVAPGPDLVAPVDPIIRPIPFCPLPGGVDHVAAGTGTRNAGQGTIRLRGVPSGAVVTQAYLYWGTITAAPAPTSATANIEGHLVSGRLIGTAAQPCWNAGGVFAAYKADVKRFVPSFVNGDYQIDGLASANTTGGDPWAPGSTQALPLSEGASLVVVYSHRSIPRTSRVYINDGPYFFAGSIDIVNPLSSPIPQHTQLKHTRLGADGQVGSGVKPYLFLTDEKTFIGPNAASLVQIKGTGSPHNKDSDWNGYDGSPLNQLWDTHTSDVSGSIPAGANSYLVRYVSSGDCMDAVAHILTAR